MKNDLISRKAAIDSLMAILDKPNHAEFLYTDEICRALNQLPSAQPEQKKGRWERHNTYRGDDTSGCADPDWRCSECGKRANVNEWFMYDLTDFCPNCGADMREEKNGMDC